MSDPISILLVDDEPLILMDLEFAAEDRGFTPCCASCVGEAMNHIDEGVDVAVLDFNLVGGENCLPIARELTKRFEQFVGATLADLLDWTEAHPEAIRGEMVLVVGGCPLAAVESTVDVDRLLMLLLASLPTKQAARVAADVSGQPRNALYQRALELKQDQSPD